MSLFQSLDHLSERFLLGLARHPTLPMLSLIGLITGLAAGLSIVGFRLAVEGLQGWIIQAGPERFDQLGALARLALPLLAGLLMGLMLWRFSGQRYVLGVPRLMERLAYHQGYISLREFLLQFVGALLAIVGGHSVGREGPNIFLGGAAGSLLGQLLKLPNNSIRTMVGCGVAAGIAASFNTPLAGVIFALEVVMLEYSLASFTPVILAAVSANALSVAVFGADAAFAIPPLALGSLTDTPLLLLLALACGAMAALFIELLQRIAYRSTGLPIIPRLLLAGLITGLLGLALPQVMGVGYHSIESTLLNQTGLTLVAGLLLAKLLASSACIGLGVPGGMIGPALFLGAMLGNLFGQLAALLLPEQAANIGLYTLLGMGALMGASLQAPLSALVAVVELTHNPEIVMPAMFVIVIAELVAGEVFGKESLFISQLKARGLNYDDSPMMRALRGASVAQVMSESFRRVDAELSVRELEQLLATPPDWLIIDLPDRRLLMPTMDLLAWFRQQPEPPDRIQLTELPARRLQLGGIELQATLQQAHELLKGDEAEALYVQRMTAPGIRRIYGVVTAEAVASAYRI